VSSKDLETSKISVVIPVFNGATSIGKVVTRVRDCLADGLLEVVLVNDGSRDDSEKVCRQLVSDSCGQVRLVQLARNFGEHSAVLAGLAHTRSDIVAVLDDDGQNPPEEIPRLLAGLQTHQWDVVYGKYIQRQHSWFRQLGSRFNDRVATIMLGKPSGLYLSSFKVMNRFMVDELLKYQGPFPYIDGLICRASDRLGQVDVQHAARLSGESNYTLRRLVRLWLNMFVGFSIAPLRLTSLIGFFFAISSLLWLIAIVIDKLWITPGVTLGIPTVLACMALFSGVQFMVLGMIGEYLGRVFLTGSGQPQYIVRYAMEAPSPPAEDGQPA